MTEPLIDIMAVSYHPGTSRWHAVTRGIVAGTAGLRPVMAFGHDLLLPALELSLQVRPRWRRRGIGSALLAAVREQAAGPRLIADVAAGSPGEAFCLRHGFRYVRTVSHDLLAYCDVHRAWLGELVDAGRPGYRLTHWTGDLPDAPRVEELLRSPSGPGNAVLTAADAGGDLAAYAVAVAGALSQPRARQYGPAVLPGHRGHRLGLWVNAALIQRLPEVHPQVTEIGTVTAVGDPWLVSREHLGFRSLRRSRQYELPLR